MYLDTGYDNWVLGGGGVGYHLIHCIQYHVNIIPVINV